MRASVAVEKLGLPTVSVVCDGFAQQAGFIAAGLRLNSLSLAEYPGHINLHSAEELERNIAAVIIDQVVEGLTVQSEGSNLYLEPESGDVVCKGTLDEVNRFFYDKEWSDGLPIVPPTVDRVEEFLMWTDHSADEVIAVLLPDKREATIWSIAVNGVMAGCRPEYMPVLVALVEALADPKFGHQHLGHTPGTEVLITINGPIIKDLGFNYEQGALRAGFQANTTIGRFWRLYLRNLAGFLPHKTDKATYGGTWRVVLAENEDALARIGWPPMSVDQGFKAGDNIVTVNSCTSTISLPSIGGPSVEEILDRLATSLVDIQLNIFGVCFHGIGVRPQILISPCVAEAIAMGGYSKEAVKEYVYEHARFTAKLFELQRPNLGSLCEAVAQGKLPKQYCESTDPDRLVPIIWSPSDLMITVSGDPGRDNGLICAQNGFIGYPVSKRIALPARWTCCTGTGPT